MSNKKHNQRQQQQHHHHHQIESEDPCMSTDPVPDPNSNPDPNLIPPAATNTTSPVVVNAPATGTEPPVTGTFSVDTVSGASSAPPTEDAAVAVASVKSDLHQAAVDAKAAYWQVSATARADIQKLIHDVEAAEGVSLVSLKKILGF